MRIRRGDQAGWWPEIVVCAAVALPSGAMAADPGPLRILTHEPFRPLPAVSAPGVAKSTAGSLRTLKFDAYGRRFSLLLEANKRLTPASSEGPALSLYQGTIENVSDSWVRLSAKGQTIRGALWDGRELYLVDSAAGLGEADADATIIFRLSDTEVPPGHTFCSDAPATGPQSGRAAYSQLLHELKNTPAIMQATGATLRLEVSALADDLLRARYSSDQQTRDEILTRINIVDGIYSSQLQVEIQVPTFNIADTTTARLSASVEPDALIKELGSLRRNTPALRARGLTHLFTGRNLTGDTVGIAFTDSLCHPEHGAGLTQLSTFTTLDALVTAHEIGHNFGAHHDGDAMYECAATPQNQYLMSPSVNSGATTFSDCSRMQILSRMQAASCLLPLSAPDLEIPTDLGTSSHAVGVPFDWTLSVSNKGGSTAYDSDVTLQVPPAVSVEEAFVAGGTCTSGGGRVQCKLGNIPAGGNRIVNLVLRSDVLGSNSISASVSTAGDQQRWNNAGDGTLIIDPEADLSVSAQAPASVVTGTSAVMSFTVTNSASIAVESVEVVTTVSGGVSVASGEIAGGTCTVSSGSARCVLPSLAAGQSVNGTLTLNTLTAGTAVLTATVSGRYIDPASANNAAEQSISVVSPVTTTSAPRSKGGGGSSGLLLIAALGALARVRHRLASLNCR